jgi:hypothetical protein
MSTTTRFLNTPRDPTLEALLAEHTNLEQAVRSWLTRSAPIDITDVVTQDEFTHDVIVTLPDRRAVVYDAT